MEFDKSRVYTALNADELQIGSKCIFADTVEELKQRVLNAEVFVKTLSRVYTESEDARFVCEEDIKHLLAYIIEPPKDSGYKPFSDIEKALIEIELHNWWVRHRYGDISLITSYNKKSPSNDVYIKGVWYTLKTLFDYFVFADDGSPCGELVDE